MHGQIARGSILAAGSRLRTAFGRSGDRSFAGFVLDEADPVRKFAVEILLDGRVHQVLRADSYVHELAEASIGDGCHGFSLSIAEEILGDGVLVEAQLANLGTAVGPPIELKDCALEPVPSPPGALRWLGGLRFSGWLAPTPEPQPAKILVDGLPVARLSPSAWSHVAFAAQEARPVRAFDVHLPARFADGDVHLCEVINETGESLAGSPVAFLAFADGLRDSFVARGVAATERSRADLYDRLMPMSTPFSEYRQWRENLPVEANPDGRGRAAMIMVGDGATEDTLESLQQQTHADWLAVSLPAPEKVSFSAAQLQNFLETDAKDADFAVFALAGTILAPDALRRIAGAFDEFPEVEAVYADIDMPSPDGTTWPLALPAFDYERMLEQGYCAYMFGLRRGALRRALASGATSLYRLFNSILDEGKIDIVHVPGALATLPTIDPVVAAEALAAAGRSHLLRRGVAARVAVGEGALLAAARVTRSCERRRITIIIPTRNRRQLLERCIDSIEAAAARQGAEILVVDNGSTDLDTLTYLAGIGARFAKVLRVPGEFNFARLNNRAAHAAEGEILCLLNNDVEAGDESWLEEMLSRIAEPDVGAVGAQLLWPSGVVQHGGVVLGPQFEAAHAFKDRMDGDGGYGDLLRVAHECSAVTAACLMTRKADYLLVGGLDEIDFPVNFNDVDFCLKLRALGRRVVFTPHAKLVHAESASRGTDRQPDRRARFEREVRQLRTKWGKVLAADPYYSPMLSLDANPFTALACPARPLRPRLNTSPCAAQIPPGF